VSGKNGTGNNSPGNNGTNSKVHVGENGTFLIFGVGVEGLEKFNISLPFLPAFLFVPLLPVLLLPVLLLPVPLLLKISFFI